MINKLGDNANLYHDHKDVDLSCRLMAKAMVLQALISLLRAKKRVYVCHTHDTCEFKLSKHLDVSKEHRHDFVMGRV